jgi:2-polyprenyl-6-hydroxyphenyl methylase/3-demethylubiquinone-9 3-methyltransferase
MEINNAIYETLGHTWWREDAGFEVSSLRYCINPVRYGYFKEQLRELPLPDRSVLDIGCGGGFLTEAFARDGFDVTGIDPAANSVKAARAHAEQNHLPIRYCEGRGESLPFADGSFAIVTCCDVLEHVDDVAQVIREVSRMLRPGGVFLFDTVNRTVLSWLILIKLWQDWGMAGLPANVHVWDKFIKPTGLVAHMRERGLLIKNMKGIGPKNNPLIFLSRLLKVRTGKVRGAAVAELFAMRETNDLAISYMGWAMKQPKGDGSKTPSR